MHRAEAACGLGYSLVCLSVKPVGKPNAGDRHVRFDERGWETERWPQAPSYRAHPRLYRKQPRKSPTTAAVKGQQRPHAPQHDWTMKYVTDLPIGA